MFYHKVDNLQSAEEREASKESHGATNCPKLVGKGDAYVSDNLVVCGCVKVDLDNSGGLVRFRYSLELIFVACTVIVDNFKAVYL